MKNLNPISVLSFCQVNKKLAILARKPTTFINLMRLHFPFVSLLEEKEEEGETKIIGKEVKNQYMKIVGEIGADYTIRVEIYENILYEHRVIEVPKTFVTKAYPTTWKYTRDSIDFKILGTRIRKEEKLWLTLSIDFDRDNPISINNQNPSTVYFTKAFTSFDAAFNYLSQKYHLSNYDRRAGEFNFELYGKLSAGRYDHPVKSLINPRITTNYLIEFITK